MNNQNSGRGIHGRGYLSALVLCAAAVGIAGYVYYSSPAQTQTDQPDAQVLATSPVAATVPVSESGQSPSTAPTDAPETSQATQPTAGKLSVCAPVEGTVLTEYAMEVLCYNQTTRDWRTHNGIDLAAEPGTQVVAAAEGQVYTVYDDDRMGMTVVIRHEGGYVTKYASLDADVLVAPGDTVAMGQAIGCVGSTALMENALADHVHFSVTHNDEPMDPGEFLAQ